MKTVVAVLRPTVIADVQAALDDEVPDLGMTVTWAEGYGRQKGHTEVYRGAQDGIDFVPKLRIDIVCDAAQVETVVRVLISVARTGAIGDGKVWVRPIEDAVTIGNHNWPDRRAVRLADREKVRRVGFEGW